MGDENLVDRVVVSEEDFDHFVEGKMGRRLVEKKIRVLRTLKPGQHMEVYMARGRGSKKALIAYLRKLKENGLDVGKGKAEYGFEMLPPQDDFRVLVIYKND